LVAEHITLDDVARNNLSLVLELIHRSGGLSRAALTTATRLNRSTIATLVGELASLNLVVEIDAEPTNRVGRPSPIVVPLPGPVTIAVNPELDAVTIAIVGLGARVDHQVRVNVDHEITPGETALLVAASIGDLSRHLAGRHIVGVGLAVPGLVRASDGLVRWAPHLSWLDVPIADLVRDATGLPTFVGNDASLGAIAEHVFGAGRGVENLVYLNGGAGGIGGGVIVDGQPLRGVSGYAGEFGHNRLGAPNRTNDEETLEDDVSHARLLAALGIERADDLELDLAILESHDPTVHAELARQRRILSVALSNAINVFNPSLVLLGGFLATVRASDPAGLDELVGSQAIPAAWADARILPAALSDHRLMIGAAELAFAPLLNDPSSMAARMDS
jgi:predicted NBD/HSP70 family sugar kinase